MVLPSGLERPVPRGVLRTFLLLLLLALGCCHGPEKQPLPSQNGSVQVIELNNTVITGVKDVKFINLLGGVAGVPALNYREGIDLIDSADVRHFPAQWDPKLGIHVT